MFSNFRKLLLITLTGLASSLLSNCATKDTQNKIVVSVNEQRMRLYNQGQLVRNYRISTSKFGLGNRPGSNCTPMGKLQIVKKIGDNAPIGCVFKARRPTGEIIRPNQFGRDPVVTRIMQLSGLEADNCNTYRRMIYIHGTPEEYKLGTPASYGCIRMSSRDVIDLYSKIGIGATVVIKRGNSTPASYHNVNSSNIAYNH